jgi:hypothetical protein
MKHTAWSDVIISLPSWLTALWDTGWLRAGMEQSLSDMARAQGQKKHARAHTHTHTHTHTRPCGQGVRRPGEKSLDQGVVIWLGRSDMIRKTEFISSFSLRTLGPPALPLLALPWSRPICGLNLAVCALWPSLAHRLSKTYFSRLLTSGSLVIPPKFI